MGWKDAERTTVGRDWGRRPSLYRRRSRNHHPVRHLREGARLGTRQARQPTRRSSGPRHRVARSSNSDQRRGCSGMRSTSVVDGGSCHRRGPGAVASYQASALDRITRLRSDLLGSRNLRSSPISRLRISIVSIRNLFARLGSLAIRIDQDNAPSPCRCP